MKKKIVLLMLCLVLILPSAVFANQTGKIELYYDKKVFEYDHVQYGDAFIQNDGVIYLPLKPLAERLKCAVSYDSQTREIVVEQSNTDGNLLKSIKLRPSQVDYTIQENDSNNVNSNKFTSPVLVKNGVTYLPFPAWQKLFDLSGSYVAKSSSLYLNSKDPNGKYYNKISDLHPYGVYHLPMAEAVDNGRDLYRFQEKESREKPSYPDYNAFKDPLVKELNNKWLEKSDQRLENGMYFSGFSLYDIKGANNIYVDFGRKDLTVVISRWNNSKNAKLIFKDVLNLFLGENKELSNVIYKDLEQIYTAGKVPNAAYKWVKIADGVSYKIELLTYDEYKTYKVPMIRVRLDHFWHE